MLRLPFEPESVLDVGANVGHWAKWARGNWPLARLTLIEANPGCMEALEATGEEFYIALVGRKPKRNVKFWSAEPTATGASAYKELTGIYEGVEPVLLEQHTLDDLLYDRSYDFAKLDTQGSELDIIEGSPRIFSGVKAILMEISIKPYNRGAPFGIEVFERMARLGFRLERRIDFCDSIQQGDYLFLR